jgi:hypothetical protein
LIDKILKKARKNQETQFLRTFENPLPKDDTKVNWSEGCLFVKIGLLFAKNEHFLGLCN